MDTAMRYIRFVLVCDNTWNGATLCANLVAALRIVLNGEEACQITCPEADYFVEGSAQWWGDQVRVRLAYCDMMTHRVWGSAIVQRPTAIGDEPIAREAVKQLYQWLAIAV
jgi:hypothetical protein